MANSVAALVRELQRKQCEGQTLEAKSAHGGTPRVYDTLSSFSNQNDGGIIVFGVDEAQGYRVVGVHDAQQLQKDVADQCEEMYPEVRISFKDALVEGKVIVAAYVEGMPMSMRPVYRRTAGMLKGAYTRIGDKDKRMGSVQLYDIDAFKKGHHDDVVAHPDAAMSMLDGPLTNDYLLRVRAQRPRMSCRDVEEALTLSGMAKDGRPTLAAMMTLCEYPQQIYPGTCLTACAVAGTCMGRGADGSRFIDSARFEGPIAEMIEGALGFVSRNTKTSIFIEGAVRRDVPEYPREAVREVIVNALMHRDYGPYSNGTPVRLELYADRLECWSPGGLNGGQDVGDLGVARIETRNPVLASTLELQGIVENRHSGIPTIRDEMRRAGLPEPEFINGNGSFAAVLRNGSKVVEELASKAEAKRSESEREVRVPRSAQGTSLQDDVLEFCREPRSRREIAERLGMNLAYAMRTIVRPLTEGGYLRLTIPEKPQSKFQRYLTNDSLDSQSNQELP